MIKQFILAHQTIAALATYMLFANAVSAMPSLDDSSSKLYRWSFNFLHGIGSALPRIIPALRFGQPSASPDSKQ
jgi:hypothetical protein